MVGACTNWPVLCNTLAVVTTTAMLGSHTGSLTQHLILGALYCFIMVVITVGRERAKKNVRCTSTRNETERKTENQVE